MAIDASLSSGCEERAKTLIERFHEDIVETARLRELILYILGETAIVGDDWSSEPRLLRLAQAACLDVARERFAGDALEEFAPLLRQRVRALLRAGNIPTGPFPQCWQPEAGLFRGVLASVREALYMSAPGGTIFYMNIAALKLLHLSPDDVMDGLNILDFIAPESFDILESSMDAGGTARPSPFTIELSDMLGRRIPAQIEVQCIGDNAPDCGLILGVMRDMRLERRLHREIQRANSRLDSLSANAPIGILITDTSGIILDANPAAVAFLGASGVQVLVGLQAEELTRLEPLVTPESLARVAAGEGHLRQRVVLPSRFGKLMRCDVFLSPILEEGHTAGLLLILVDTTEEAALLGYLGQSERLSSLADVVGGVAHELNNPLTGIMGYAQYLLAHAKEPGHKERLERIAEEARRCQHIITDLLIFARECETEKTPQDINDLVHATLALCQYQFKSDDIALVMIPGRGLPEAPCASRDIMRVLLALLMNAHHAVMDNPEGARRVTITTGVNEGYITITVEDTGCGISQTLRHRVFDPFFTTHALGDGIGLGLSISYGIVENHGGHIRIESKPGEGSRVLVELPIGPSPPCPLG